MNNGSDGVSKGDVRMICPNCGSSRVWNYTENEFKCKDCGHMMELFNDRIIGL
ncbi:MAG: TFIIB-type zinc ribbon-containing protein [Candidatus Woesearchaeota archaeon]